MTSTVKYYSSDDVGAPVVKQGGWGHIVNLYRQICQGYNELPIESIFYSAEENLVTINLSAGHGYRKYQTLLIDLFGSQFHNTELFIVKVNSTSIKCSSENYFDEILFAGGTCKVAPLGMVEEFNDNANKGAFRFEDPTENVYLVINDTEPSQFAWNSSTMLATPGIYMCKNLTSIDGDCDLPMPYNDSVPNAYKESEWKTGSATTWGYGLGNIMYQNAITASGGILGTNSPNLDVTWSIIGNGSFHYLYFYINSINTVSDEPIVYTFGAIKKKYSYDKNNYIMRVAYNNAYLNNNTTHFYQIQGANSNYNTSPNGFSACVANNIFSRSNIPSGRNITMIVPSKFVDSVSKSDNLLLKGLKSEYRVSFFSHPKKYSDNTYSGQSSYSYPHFDGETILSKIGIYESGTNIERGEIPGALWIHHEKPFANRSVVKMIDSEGNEFHAINMTNYTTNVSPSTFILYQCNILISLRSSDWSEMPE